MLDCSHKAERATRGASTFICSLRREHRSYRRCLVSPVKLMNSLISLSAARCCILFPLAAVAMSRSRREKRLRLKTMHDRLGNGFTARVHFRCCLESNVVVTQSKEQYTSSKVDAPQEQGEKREHQSESAPVNV